MMHFHQRPDRSCRFLCAALLALLTAIAGYGQKAPTAKASVKKPSDRPVKQTSSQASKNTSKTKPVVPAPTPTPDPEADRKRFDTAVAATTNSEKARLLKRFVEEFPDSELKPEAYDYLVTARAIAADEQVKAGDVRDGIATFRLAIEEAPMPTPDRLFEDVIAKIPANLFYGGQRAAALDLAAAIERKYAGNTRRLLGVAGFYLSIENGAEARRVAESAIAIDPASAPAYQALGLAHRLNFELEEAAKAYAKALELDPASSPAKRSLAEMKRATGSSDEAAAIYREMVASNPNDVMARNGLILSLFDSGKKADAEKELAAFADKHVKNFALFAGVAYWYAANGSGDKAIEYGQKAVDAEPRYIWGHIALARGLMRQNKPIDAERVLIKARQFGNFPTLEYEIASARFKAGLFREAVEELQKNFVLRDGMVETRLGGRLTKAERSFTDLLAHERRASILEPAAADDAEASNKLRILFELTDKLAASADEAEILRLTGEFVKGEDGMKLHRQLHSADILLQKSVSPATAGELVKAAVANTDAGLDVPAAGAAVMASELYESRSLAFARNEIILIPEVPRATLSSILRGRIEELAGWALYLQRNYPAAAIRLRRAISVMPDKSAWWRSSVWRLGSALEADGKDKEALENYIQSYKTDRPSGVKYGIIATLYQKVNNSIDGLEEKIGPNPAPTATTGSMAVVTNTQQPEPVKSNAVEASAVKVEPSPSSAKTAEETPAEKKEIVAVKSDPPPSVDTARNSVPPTPQPEPTVAETEKATVLETKVAVNDPPKNEDAAKAVAAVETTAKPLASTASIDKAKDKPDEPLKTVEAPPQSTEKPDKPIPGEVVAEKIPQPKAEPKVEKAESETTVKLPAEPPVQKKAEVEVPSGVVPSPTASNTEKSSKQADDQPVNLLRDPLPELKVEAKTETKAETEPEAEAKNEPAEQKPLVIVKDPVKASSNPQTRELFDPVIITVPRSVSQKPPAVDKANSTAENTKENVDASGSTRKRVVDGQGILSDQKCSIAVDQENISLLNGGGSLGVLVSIEGEGTTGDVTASSNSPRDVEARAEPEIVGLSGRRFYVIKSISAKTGTYQVNFESPCGKKEITVRVR